MPADPQFCRIFVQVLGSTGIRKLTRSGLYELAYWKIWGPTENRGGLCVRRSRPSGRSDRERPVGFRRPPGRSHGHRRFDGRNGGRDAAARVDDDRSSRSSFDHDAIAARRTGRPTAGRDVDACTEHRRPPGRRLGSGRRLPFGRADRRGPEPGDRRGGGSFHRIEFPSLCLWWRRRRREATPKPSPKEPHRRRRAGRRRIRIRSDQVVSDLCLAGDRTDRRPTGSDADREDGRQSAGGQPASRSPPCRASAPPPWRRWSALRSRLPVPTAGALTLPCDELLGLGHVHWGQDPYLPRNGRLAGRIRVHDLEGTSPGVPMALATAVDGRYWARTSGTAEASDQKKQRLEITRNRIGGWCRTRGT
jgi:hypothetical protein